MNKFDKLEQIYQGHHCPDCAHWKHCDSTNKGPCKYWTSLTDWVNSALTTLDELAGKESK